MSDELGVADVIQEMERGLRIYRAFEKGREVALTLASIEQRAVEAQRMLEQLQATVATAEQSWAERREQLRLELESQVADTEQRLAGRQQQADLEWAETIRLGSEKVKALDGEIDALIAARDAEQRRLVELSGEATALRAEIETLTEQVRAARDAKDALLRA